jgi:hypothetical protein
VAAPVLNQSIVWNQTLTVSLDSGTLALNATATSGLPVTYTCSDENVATVSGNVLNLVGVGQAVITASQPGNAYYHPAPIVVKILTVTESGGDIPMQAQTIQWDQDLTVSLSDRYLPLTATATSGLPVSYTCNDETVATVYGDILILNALGLAIITASQAGNDMYYPAQDVMKVLNVTPVGVVDHASNDIHVWPNPSNSLFNVECNMSNATYCVTDLYGKEIMRGKLDGNHLTMDLSDAPAGMYLLLLQSIDGKTATVKVAKSE